MKKVIIILVVLAVIVLGYYIFQGSRFKKTSTFEPQKTDDNNISENTDITDQNNSENNAVETAPNIEVKSDDCHNDCRKFTKDNEKEYCEEICGLTTYFENPNDSGGSSADCSSEKGIQKDYCLKDIAVGNKDFKTCDEIIDANIKKTCSNRITEDLMEGQNSFGEPVD